MPPARKTKQEAKTAEGRTGKQKPSPRTPNSKASRPARAPRIEGSEGVDLMEPGSGIAPASRSPAPDDIETSLAAREARDNVQALIERGKPFYVPDDAPEWVPHRPARPEKSEGGIELKIVSEYTPRGDQPAAIAELVEGVRADEDMQVLLGVTGSGKTFTMAHVIEQTQRPALILAPNKTLAAQLYGEFKSFFPDNAVEYFVSYYDYYQPEAYVPRSDTYIEKESSINEQIDRMRHSATRSLLERDDVIIVASVSCIYGIGSVETYTAMTFDSEARPSASTSASSCAELVALQYKRNDAAFQRGTFRVRATPRNLSAHLEDRAWRISLLRRRAGRASPSSIR